MDLRQLRYFVAIIEQGSFSRAANVLHIAQPALSLHVRNMEAELGAPLLFRSPKGVLPTEAGITLLRHARIILDQFLIAEEEVRGFQNDPSGEVRLGLPGTISQLLAVPLITCVLARFPRIKLRISEAMSGFVLDWMRTGQVDLAVLYDDAGDPAIRATQLLEEDLILFGPAGNKSQHEGRPAAGAPIACAEVASLPLILPGEGHSLRTLLDRAALTAGHGLTTVIDIDSYSNIKKLVAEGFGYSVLPEDAVGREVAEGRLEKWSIHSPRIRRSVYLCHANDRPLTNAVSAVRALARETLVRLALEGQWLGATPVSPGDGKDETSHSDMADR